MPAPIEQQAVWAVWAVWAVRAVYCIGMFGAREKHHALCRSQTNVSQYYNL
jgi:hypothetical protein